jgi:CP family cyanate transporter-like MFS transporter
MSARRTLLGATVVISTATLLAIGLAPDFMPIAVLMAFGLTHSGGFTIALAMLSEYPRDAASSARLTAMAFSVTFLVAALGPLISGAVLQSSGSWPLVYGLLALVCAGQLPPIIRLRRGIIIG